MSTRLLSPSGSPEADQGVARWHLLLVLAIAFALRLIHVACILPSPLAFQRGPDEDYYVRFGQAVASGQAGTPEFAFMDPAYGYVLGAVFKLLGANVFVVALLQVLLDTLTVYAIFLIGRELGRPRAGLIGAAVYGVTCTAVFFSATLLKATWVANFMTLCVLCCLILLRTRERYPWFLFGIFCGYGVALRSNLLLTVGLCVALLEWLSVGTSARPVQQRMLRLALLALGLLGPLTLLSVRNEQISGTWSPVPNNGGVVLHHLYNPENPRAEIQFPKFVRYGAPSAVWVDYSNEAERRAGHSLTPHEVDRYWRGEAKAYIVSHPLEVAANITRKLAQFVAYGEVPNNRSLAQDRLFSPVLRALPSPFGWLLAFGVPGVVLLVLRDRRGLLLAAPILATLVTVGVFFAEDRFRFHAVPSLAAGAGFFLQDLYGWIKRGEARRYATGMAAAALIGTCSLLLARELPASDLGMGRVVWGYLKMNTADATAKAKALALPLAAEQPNNAKMQEALAYIAVVEARYSDAVLYYRKTVALKPRDPAAHYNLAKMLLKTGNAREAQSEAALAAGLEPLPEYRRFAEELAAAR